MGKVRGRREKKESGGAAAAEGTAAAGPVEPVLHSAAPTTFYGLVDPGELDYFKQAESTLNANAFVNDDERSGFISSVLEEARGKELKLMTNQICSKLMERLALVASEQQVRRMFAALEGHFVALANHKYSSHCLETLFVRSAAIVEHELVAPELQLPVDEEDGLAFVTLENLLLLMAEELTPAAAAMLHHKYALHVLRLVILVLSGKELPLLTVSNLTLRLKKSKIARKMIEIRDTEDFSKAHQTPPLFRPALQALLEALLADQTRTSVRELASDPVASPVLQLVILVEGMVDKQRRFWHMCFEDAASASEPKESAFVEHLLLDTVGSHFLQHVVAGSGGRPKNVERLYRLYMAERVVKLCNRRHTGAYVVVAAMGKLKPAVLEGMLDQLVPLVPSYLQHEEGPNTQLVQAILDASAGRGNYKKEELVAAILGVYSLQPLEFLENLLQLLTLTLGNTRGDWPTADERRRLLFLQKLCDYDRLLLGLTAAGLTSMEPARVVAMCTHGVFSHVVEKVCTLPQGLDMVARRKLLNVFSLHIAALACNLYGSHVVDALWEFSVLLNNYKDRFALELWNARDVVKESTYGRLVWKNWSMELYARKRYDWKALIKQQGEEAKEKAAEQTKEAAKTASPAKRDAPPAPAPPAKRARGRR